MVRMKRFLVLLALLGIASAAAPAAGLLTPSVILAAAAKYERAPVTVIGIVSNIAVRQAPRGAIVQFRLCDSRCVNVVESTKATIYAGQSITVSGTFYTFFVNGPIQARDLILVTSP
jgi:hypothetical protein